MSGASALATYLHAQICMSISWSDDCQKPNGGSHAKALQSTAKEVLGAENPAAALHGVLCDLEIQSAHGNVYAAGCPVRQAHEKKCWEILSDVAGLQP